MSAVMPRAVGGYFELELPRARSFLHDDALRFQSSRAAFLALVRSLRPKAVWMPWYICDAMLEPLHMARIPVKRYAIDRQMRPQSVELQQDEWLVYVNYFGLCDRQVDDVLDRFPRDSVVIDNAQALFAQPRDCLATIYSPRKFVGVPDGGYLVTRKHIDMPDASDQTSIQRCAHLLRRIADDAEAGYAAYAAAEESLKHQEPLRMSDLTQRILASIDYDAVRARRVENFIYLHERLQRHNRFAIHFDRDNAVPLCYPLFDAPAGLREELRQQRIYTPTYWPDVAESKDAPEFERTIPASALFLPCDQRLTTGDLEPIVQSVLERLT
ncbi:hypothetical protein AWB74_02612 [Caballeronia arvi]|uniref:DegT/DnrJ/EryC1/StrS aminotransferase n=1 Tax=Caballeronia arvi TaxID=1777135 RepID=A0A158IJR8_9BURK|nr:hypothetical protein [Caballeronia arvi]SAL56798.1 hypothetical protein AWB74_02612 [Caballeronia arvi]